MGTVSGRGRPARPTSRYYSRMARVNEVLREVLAEEIEVRRSWAGEPRQLRVEAEQTFQERNR